MSLIDFLKTTSNNTLLVLLCASLFVLLFIGTKNKINMDFSKRSNKIILITVLLIFMYSFNNKVMYFYEEIKKDAINPGKGIIGKNLISAKKSLLDFNKGESGRKYQDLQQAIKDLQKPIGYNYKISDPLKEQMKSEGAVGLVTTNFGKMYSIKSDMYSRNSYVLEGKIDRNTMTTEKIKIDLGDEGYANFYPTISNIVSLDPSTDVQNILKEPVKNNVKTLQELNNDYELIINDNFSTEQDKKNAKKIQMDIMCKKCGIQNLSESNSKQFLKIDNFDAPKGTVPLCKQIDTGITDNNGNPVIENNCCVIEESNTKYACPEMCFDWTDDQKGRDSDTFTATEYIDIIKTNPVCSSIDIKKQDSKQNGIDFSDITGNT